MENSYKNVTKNTKEEYSKFQKFNLNTLHPISYIIYILLGIILAIMGIVYLVQGNNMGLLYILLGIVFTIYRISSPMVTTKIILSQDKEVENSETGFSFSDKQIKVEYKENESSLTYDEISKAYETPDNVYLYTNTRQAFLLNKHGFEEGKEKEALAFLQTKLQEKYKKKK